MNASPALAADLVRGPPYVVVLPAELAGASRQSRRRPRPFRSSSPQRRSGSSWLVASFNRPGGNVTGISSFNNALSMKRIGLLRELVPKARVVALWSTRTVQLSKTILNKCKRLRAHLG